MQFYPATSYKDYFGKAIASTSHKRLGLQASGDALAYSFAYSEAAGDLGKEELPILCDSSFSICCTDLHSMDLLGLDHVLKMVPSCNDVDEKSTYLMPPSGFCAASIHATIKEFRGTHPGNFRIMLAPSLRFHHADSTFDAPFSDSDPIIYIGPDDRWLKSICYSHYGNTLYHFDPLRDVNIRRIDASKFVSQRLRMMQMAEGKSRFGLVFASLKSAEVERYLDVIASMNLDKRDINTQIISAGKLNLVKVSNFEDLDALVIFGCINSAFSLSKQLSIPVLLPHEFVCLTLGIEMLSHKIDLGDPKFFFHMVQIGTASSNAESMEKDVVLKESFSALTISRLHERTFQGLDYSQGADSVSELSTEIKPGLFGTARGYVNEGKYG